MTVVGIETKQGTFKNEQGNEVAYKSTYLHLAGENENTVGQCTACYKLAKNFEIIGASYLEDLLGQNVLLAKEKTQYGTTVTAIIVRE